MTYYTDSPFLHMRKFIDLDPELAQELAARLPTHSVPLVLIADSIMLSGAEIADRRDVTLIARVIHAGVQGIPPLKLYRSGHAPDGEVTTEGQVHPPIAVEGLPPEKGRAGTRLTVYTLSLGGAVFAESHGQQGGRCRAVASAGASARSIRRPARGSARKSWPRSRLRPAAPD